MYKCCCCLRCSTVLVSQRGNAEGVQEAKGDPPREVVENRKAVATPRPRDRRDIGARRRTGIATWRELSPGGKEVEAKTSRTLQRSSEYQSSEYQLFPLLVPLGLAGLSPFRPPDILRTGGTQSFLGLQVLRGLAGLSPFRPQGALMTGGTQLVPS